MARVGVRIADADVVFGALAPVFTRMNVLVMQHELHAIDTRLLVLVHVALLMLMGVGGEVRGAEPHHPIADTAGHAEGLDLPSLGD